MAPSLGPRANSPATLGCSPCGTPLCDGYSRRLSYCRPFKWVRALCSRRIYGWRFAMGVPVRALIGNWLNCAATGRALALYFDAKIHGRPLVWVKTEHAYPNPAALDAATRPLGQILVGSQYVMQADVDEALTSKAPGERIGEYLVRRGRLSEAELYMAL